LFFCEAAKKDHFKKEVACNVKKELHFSSPRNNPAGIGTMHANETCWLPGFIGPVPPPLLIRNIFVFSYEKNFSTGRGRCQDVFKYPAVYSIIEP
jgi:hypothetical protein